MGRDSSFVVISLTDIARIFRAYRQWIIWSSLLGGSLLLALALLRTPTYPAEATFQDLLGGSGTLMQREMLSDLTGEMDKGPLKSPTVLHSHTLLEGPVKRLGYQAIVTPSYANPNSRIRRIARNLKIETLSLLRKKRLPISDPAPRLRLRDVDFSGELPLGFSIRFTSDQQFDLYRGRKRWIANCQVGKRIVTDSFEMRVETGPGVFRGRRYSVELLPTHEVTRELAHQLRIKEDGNDPQLLRIRFNHPDRHFAAEMVNTILVAYEEYLDQVRTDRAAEQLAYLNERRNVTFSEVHDLFDENAAYMAASVDEGHFFDLQTETAFLSKNQSDYEEKLLHIDLELRFLDLVAQEGANCCDMGSDMPLAEDLLSKIRALRQTRDSLNFAMKGHGQLGRDFEEQMAELRALRKREGEIESLISNIKSGTPITGDLAILEEIEAIPSAWLSQVGQAEFPEEWNHCVACLENALRTCQIEAKIIQDRMAYQREGGDEFQGITVELGEELYLEYARKLDEVQRTLSHLSHLRTELDNPDFELTSLAGTLGENSIFEEMIFRASNTLMDLQDDKNRTPKEQERLREQLTVQRRFITLYLDQAIALQAESEELVKEKIGSVQQMMLDVLHRDLSLLEGELLSFAEARKRTLEQERSLFQQQLADLRDQTTRLPEKWLAEQQLALCLKTAKESVDSVTQLVESKNIAHNLDFIDAKILDSAPVATIPNPPRLLLFSILGAILGGGLAFATAIGRSVLQGVVASKEGLIHLDQEVAGTLSGEPLDPSDITGDDLEVLRHIWSCFEKAPEAKLCLLLNNQGEDLGGPLARLYQMRGQKTLVINCSLGVEEPSPTPGLLHFLEGEAPLPDPVRRKEYDYLPAGGVTRYPVERLSSKRFKELLEWAKAKYDEVILTTKAGPLSAEGRLLIELAPRCALSLAGETLHQLRPLIALGASKQITYLFWANQSVEVPPPPTPKECFHWLVARARRVTQQLVSALS